MLLNFFKTSLCDKKQCNRAGKSVAMNHGIHSRISRDDWGVKDAVKEIETLANVWEVEIIDIGCVICNLSFWRVQIFPQISLGGLV